MTRAIRSEIGKLTGTRAAGILCLFAGAAVVAMTVGTTILDGSCSPAEIGAALAITVPLVVMPIAALVVTEEYRHHTVWQSFVVVPQRWRFLAAKAALVAPLAFVAVAGVSLAALAVADLTAAVAGGAGPGVRDVVELAARCGMLGALAATFGLTVGALTRHGATAVSLLLVWSAVLERLLAALPEIGRYLAPLLPLANIRYFVTGDDEGIAFHWGADASLGYVLAFCAVLLGCGVIATERAQP